MKCQVIFSLKNNTQQTIHMKCQVLYFFFLKNNKINFGMLSATNSAFNSFTAIGDNNSLLQTG